MRLMKRILYYILLFAAGVGILIICSAGAQEIPDALVHEHLCTSARYLCERPAYTPLYGDADAVLLDHSADAITLNIALHADADAPFESVAWSRYYYEKDMEETKNLQRAAEDGQAANQEYLRYWHGSSALMRLAHIFLDLRQIYPLHALLLLLCMTALLTELLRHADYVPAAGLLLSSAAVHLWAVPFCLEYTWVFILMLLNALLVCRFIRRGRHHFTGALFLLTGILTNYLDFLSSETLTLTVPLLLALYLLEKTSDWKQMARFTAASCTLWGAGYAGMWCTKWLYAGAVLKIPVFSYINGHIAERAGTDTPADYPVIATLWRNLTCLLPLSIGLMGGICLLLMGLPLLLKKPQPRKVWLLWGCTAIIPYIRYLVLRNHAYLHYFFTYRAQMAVVLALCLMLLPAFCHRAEK